VFPTFSLAFKLSSRSMFTFLYQSHHDYGYFQCKNTLLFCQAKH
jgi:hypothetical protein